MNYKLINTFPKLFENPVFFKNEIEKVCPKISLSSPVFSLSLA